MPKSNFFKYSILEVGVKGKPLYFSLRFIICCYKFYSAFADDEGLISHLLQANIIATVCYHIIQKRASTD